MRKRNDNYPSEPAMLACLLDLITPYRLKRHHVIFEPACGAGMLASPLTQAGYEVITNDIELFVGPHYHMDASKQELWNKVGKIDWVITNPPYTHLDAILENALAMATCGVAMILRLSALEPVCYRSERGLTLDAYKDNMRYIIPFSAPRPSFTANGKTDRVTTAWFVWDKGWSWKDLDMESPFQFAMGWKKEAL